MSNLTIAHDINVEPVLRTQPNGAGVGLATVIVEVPAYIWMELLTHKRVARNASSARAQGFSRHVRHGLYIAPRYYQADKWMRIGDPLADDVNDRVRDRIEALYDHIVGEIADIQHEAGVRIANEQINRLLPISRMMRGVMTATIPAWEALIKLRSAPTADVLMQQVAGKIESVLESMPVQQRNQHVPFAPDGADLQSDATWRIAAARLARVSAGAPGEGQRSDEELAQLLIADGHWSPFEHIAHWTRMPIPSALCSDAADTVDDSRSWWGWQNYRAELES